MGLTRAISNLISAKKRLLQTISPNKLSCSPWYQLTSVAAWVQTQGMVHNTRTDKTYKVKTWAGLFSQQAMSPWFITPVSLTHHLLCPWLACLPSYHPL